MTLRPPETKRTAWYLAQLLAPTEFPARAYSGRDMLGQQCLGIPMESLLDLLNVGVLLKDFAHRIFPAARIDELGTGWIVYFPNVPAPEEEKHA